jgi:glycosyltransferase involved in cell wall biosynthesis
VTSETTNIRVLHVAPTAFGQDGLFGGGERYPLELARALAKLDGVDCELLTFGSRPRLIDDDAGLRIRVVQPVRYLGGHPAHPLAPAMISNVTDADVVHTHHLRSTPSRLAAVAARASRPWARSRGLVVTDHGLGGGDWWGLLPRLFDRFLAVSQHSATVLGAPPAKTRVIYGGVDPRRFKPDPESTRTGVLFVGRLTPHKGLDRLIEALPDGARLTIAGTGGHDRHPPERNYLEDLRSLAGGREVRFVGAIADEQLPALYRDAAVVALPSVNVTCYGKVHAVSELLGLTAIEAMASGTPVVASRIGGLPEVVVDGETGYLVDPGDVDALHERLAELLANPAHAHQMGTAARARVLARFTWEQCARRCLYAYRELLN